MSEKSTVSRRGRKAGSARKLFRPEKPKHFRPDKPGEIFPLTPLGNGAWAKKIKGELKYFGSWGHVVNGKLVQKDGDDWWKPALDLYEGRTPRIKSGVTRVKDLCNHFLTAKRQLLASEEIGQRQFDEYKHTTDLLCEVFGKERPIDELSFEDFAALRAKMAKRWGPVRLGNSIVRVRTIFKFAFASKLSTIHPDQRYGDRFNKPSAGVMRKNRKQNGHRMLEAAEIRALTDAACPQLKAMILLGVNCGFGNHDIAMLPLSAIDLDAGWVDYPRPKTGIERRCPLWPETVSALREAIAARPEPKEGADTFVFLMDRGRPWKLGRQWLSGNVAFPIVSATGALMRSVGVHRPGIGFYTLRHVFRTKADESLDRVAIDRIMGHSDGSMGAVYRERIDDARLRTVVDHVRAWLYPTPASAENALGGES